MKANLDTKNYAREHDVYLYQVAEAVEYSEADFSRKLRTEFSPEEKEVIFKAIDEISSGNTSYKTNALRIITRRRTLKKRAQKKEEMRELTEIAKKYEVLGKKPEELAATLKGLKDAGGSAYADMIAVLDSSLEIEAPKTDCVRIQLSTAIKDGLAHNVSLTEIVDMAIAIFLSERKKAIS